MTLLGNQLPNKYRFAVHGMSCSPQRKTCKDCWAFCVQRLMQRLHPDQCATVCTAKQEQIKRYQVRISSDRIMVDIGWLHGWHSHVCWIWWISQVSGPVRTGHASSLAPGTCPAYPGLAHLHHQIQITNGQLVELLTGNLSNRDPSRTKPLVSGLFHHICSRL